MMVPTGDGQAQASTKTPIKAGARAPGREAGLDLRSGDG